MSKKATVAANLGLNAWAEKLVKNARQYKNESHDDYKNLTLYCYELPDGRILCESIQSIEWASDGLVALICLHDEAGKPLKESIWSGAEMQAYL